MPRVFVVSDIHYAGPSERTRTNYRSKPIRSPLLRFLTHQYHHHIWMRDPLVHNYLLDDFLAQTADADWVVGNGDFSCDSGGVGVSDPAAFQSARECLGRLRGQFSKNFSAVLGDHELGKLSLFGGAGGMRLKSWRLAVGDLQIDPFWRIQFGRYVLMGVTSSLIALPVFAPELLAEEKQDWEALRAIQLGAIEEAFRSLGSQERVFLFCHDPSALPFLGQLEAVRAKMAQVERTIIGHLHSPLILWKGRRLAGMPRIKLLGNTVRRYSTALNQARCWPQFKVTLCPSLSGIQLLKDGGYLRIDLDTKGGEAQVQVARLPWRRHEEKKD